MFRFESLPVIFKRILLFLFVLIFAALQNTDGLLPCIFDARFFILIPLIVAIGMCEGEIAGLLYGILAGGCWDVCSGGIDGFHTFLLALIGVLSGLLVRFFMRNKLLTQYCICAVSAFTHCVLYWLISVYIPVGDNGYSKLLTFYLPSAVITTAISFIIYYIIRTICYKLQEKEAKINQSVVK
ncbi:MAG: rod shape-determining protein MreD [Clostridia bacterium]|nr:rod shape-determining protein MreD [Clostridia bacterium]